MATSDVHPQLKHEADCVLGFVSIVRSFQKKLLPPVSLQANKLHLLVKRKKKKNQALRRFRGQQKCSEIEFFLSNETQRIVLGKLGHLVPKLSLSLILSACFEAL